MLGGVKGRTVQIVVLLAALAALAVNAATAASTVTIRVGSFGTFDETSVADQLAFEQIARKNGIKSTITTFGTPQAAVVAVTRGDIDIGIVGIHTTSRAIAEGAPLRTILGAQMTNEWVFVSSTPDVASLRGKTIGYQTPGTETQAFAAVLLRRAGIKTSEVKLVAVPGSPNRAIALMNGQLDAAWLNYVDFLRVVREAPRFRALTSARNLVPFSALRAFVVTDSYLEANRPRLQKIVNTLLASYESMYTAEGKSRWLKRAKATVFKDDPALADRVYANYRRIKIWPHRSQFVTKPQWESRSLFWLAGDVVDGVPTYERMWDMSLWRAAAKTR